MQAAMAAVCVMVVIMRRGAGEVLVADMEATSPVGPGRLYVTNMAVAYEVDGRGLYLNYVPHRMILEFGMSGMLLGTGRFRMVWREDDDCNDCGGGGGDCHGGGPRTDACQPYVFEFRTRQYGRLCGVLDGIWPRRTARRL